MNKQQLKIAGTQAATEAVRRRVDLALGMALLRDRRIPVGKKALAVVLGVAGMLLVLALEIPLELLNMVFALPLGIIDGLEVLVLPVVMACALLPYLTPQTLVDMLRAERAQRI